jgi:hypothetical protein
MNKSDIIYKRSTPIPILNANQDYQYKLKENNIDPNKNSPPNSWTRRLNSRFDIYYAMNKDAKCKRE